jgi:hypothetical protein
MIPNLMEGVVVDTNDPSQMGRMKIWVPSVDGELYNIEDLPWATYVSPMAGQTRDYPAGPGGSVTEGFMSYGFWAVPKSGALCVVGFLYGDPNRRVYMGSFFRDHGNRSLPTGRNRSDLAKAPVSDTFDPVEPQTTNLSAQFSGQLEAPEATSRGSYERSVAQDKTDKDGSQGYQADLIEPKGADGKPQYDPQTYVLTTPGRHSLIMQDNPANGRLRLKTAAGHQIILDDANERIYVSTARGLSWFEMDQDGRIHVYGADSFSLSSGGSINLTAVKNVNISAGKDVNMQASGVMKLAACGTMNVSGKGVNLDSGADFNILAAGSLIQTGSNIHLNGPGAGSADCPDAPDTIPTHEPWKRAGSASSRGKNWKA